MQSSKLSTSKIVTLLVFFAAALMASVVIYKFNNQATLKKFPEQYGTMFPVAHAIKPFELQTNNGAFTEKNLQGYYTLMFFGFTHCAQVCPTTLSTINKAYPDLKNIIPNLQVVLVSLDPERDDLNTLSSYTKGFNKDFIGATAEIKSLHKIQSQFGIYSEKANVNGNNYQLQHTASILLFNPTGKYMGLFRYGLSPKELTDALQQSIN